MELQRKKLSGGRPTREEAELLSEKIVEVAGRLMLEHGYSATSIEAIAGAAGVAKRTLYHRFPDKRDLFAAVIQRRREQFLAPVAKISAAGGDIEEQLKLIGRHILDWGLQSDSVAMKRLLAAEAERFPNLLVTFYEEGRVRTIDAITAVIARAVDRGALDVEDAQFAAGQFLQMIMGPVELLVSQGVSPCSGDQRYDYVDKTVNLFLNGCRPRDSHNR
jgi:TetR/AcrR family transcriptional regulator, mexJK operon transcriptional repressor